MQVLNAPAGHSWGESAAHLVILYADSPEAVAAARAHTADPILVVSAQDPEPLYRAGANSVIAEPATEEARQAVLRFWQAHNQL